MLPIERKLKIKELLIDRKAMKISELSRELDVSEMTIHRDIKPLVAEGIVTKTFGGIALANDSEIKDKDVCDFCNGSLNDRLIYRMFLTGNTPITACCAHCGVLKHREMMPNITHAICRDFLLQTTISANQAWYVMDTSLHVGCCKPQVLTFEQKNHAKQFVSGFGGKVYNFSEVMEIVYQRMQ